ncbi:Uncharacterized protein FKW44_012166 [Caligus rogercresseyi]|uniref:Uncharacterized protein n=1 Tax=Caligus rogercresseyi TaxID=217165 RepID=A0A7T8HJC5_CALRO|nr:Uncharacterized protein FKW44_012166 [Caligus rogercresseyi]
METPDFRSYFLIRIKLATGLAGWAHPLSDEGPIFMNVPTVLPITTVGCPLKPGPAARPGSPGQSTRSTGTCFLPSLTPALASPPSRDGTLSSIRVFLPWRKRPILDVPGRRGQRRMWPV